MTEGCEFRDLYEQFQALNVTIYGASFDYGAATSANQFFADRITVVLDPAGNQRLFYKVPGNTKQHPNDVLADMTKILAE